MTAAPPAVTVARARQLERARISLDRGHITYSRWVELLRDWVAGTDVSAVEIGCETVAERIMLRFHDQIVGATQVANELRLASVNTAAVTLIRMAAQKHKRARKMAHGRYKIIGKVQR